MSLKFKVPLIAIVEVEIHNPDVIERVTGPGGDEWRSYLYQLHTREDVLEMLADNCVRNGVEVVSVLDGWADLPPGAATMRIVDSDGAIKDEIEVIE